MLEVVLPLYGVTTDLIAELRSAIGETSLRERLVDRGPVGNHDLSFLVFETDGSPHLEELVVHRLARRGPLISAWLYDREYEEWQNAEDPLLYELAGRSLAGLPMKHNDLPAPLDRMIVDTSRNPGRRILRSGYVEAVGHRMWLGPEFFARVPGASRDAVLSAPWLETRQHPGDLLEVVAGDELFRDASSAEVQDRLRHLLFGV